MGKEFFTIFLSCLFNDVWQIMNDTLFHGKNDLWKATRLLDLQVEDFVQVYD